MDIGSGGMEFFAAVGQSITAAMVWHGFADFLLNQQISASC